MADSTINVVLPMPEATVSVEYAEVKATNKATSTANDTVTIEKALENKNNSLQITVDTTGACNMVIKAGGHYPNACLGDLTLALEANKKYVVILEDISRFETKTGNVKVKGVVGTVYAVAKRAGLDPTTAYIYQTDKDY